jgi:Gluconate 2-dehydrogenase subunit 3
MLQAISLGAIMGPMQWIGTTQATLAAAVDRIIPADDFPGAWEAGVGDYLERILDTDLQPLAAEFLAGLISLEAQAASGFGQSFASLTPENQDEILKTVEQTQFFRLLIDLTAEGYYSDPANGGNRGMTAWKMIGYQPKGQM